MELIAAIRSARAAFSRWLRVYAVLVVGVECAVFAPYAHAAVEGSAVEKVSPLPRLDSEDAPPEEPDPSPAEGPRPIPELPPAPDSPPAPDIPAEPPSEELQPGMYIDDATAIQLNKDYGWPAGTLQEQLDRDPTMVPYGKGALFVPAMVKGLDEPPVEVWHGNEKIIESTTGTRIVLEPGDYFVQVGSGASEQRFGRTISVHEQKTSILPVTWSGLSVHVIDPQLNSLRQPYEIMRMSETDQEYMGVGFGRDERAGEQVFVWLLQPGLYKIVRLGTSYVSRVDFATVRLLPGRHTQFLLVLDPDTGAFQGAGEARRQDLFKANQRGVWGSLLVGGDVTATQRQGAVDVPNGNGWGLHAWIDTKFNIGIFDNPLLLRLQIEEGQIKIPAEPWQKQQDRLQLDLLYLYKYVPWAGPYIRATGLVNAFASVEYFPQPQEVRVYDLVSGALLRQQTGVQYVKVAPPWGNINLREGAGFNMRIFKNLYGETTVRSGLGFRQIINAPGVLQDVSDPTQRYHQFYQLRQRVNQIGVEAIVIAMARITRWVVVNVIVDSLVPFNGINLLDLDIEGTLAVKLTQYVSLNYVARYSQFPEVYRQPIVEQDWYLRFSLGLL